MIRTFTRTLFMDNEELQKATIKVYSYNASKYTDKITDETEFKFTGLKAWDVIEGGAEAEEIEASYKMTDDNHEYLVLHLDGSEVVFRNSYVDMFIR